MQKIVFDHVTKYFGDSKAVNDAHLTIQEGEFLPCLVRVDAGKRPCCAR